MSMVVIGVFTSEFEAQAVCHRLDAEGIAARIAGKGRDPRWQPARLEDVDDAWVEGLFTTPMTDELELDEQKPGL